MAALSETPNTQHKFHVPLCVRYQDLKPSNSSTFFQPGVEWQSGGLLWGRGFTVRWREQAEEHHILCVIHLYYVTLYHIKRLLTGPYNGKYTHQYPL